VRGFLFCEVFINKTNVKQKENIFEELDKMRNLIHAKPGVVISEQDEDPIETIRKGISSMAINDSNEQSIVDTIVNNYKTKEQFVNFLSQFKQKNGKEFADAASFTLTPRDKPHWDTLVKHLASIGVTMKEKMSNNRYNGFTFEGLDGAVPTAVDASKVEEMWKDPKVSCVTIQPGVRQSKMKNGSTVYVLGKVVYYANGRKKLADGTMANYNCSTEFKSRAASNPEGRANVVSSYSKELQTSLGVTPTGQLSDTDIDLILKRLEGGESVGATSSDTQTIPMDTNGQPDIDKIIASL
jgi:hypothetical protein